MNTRRLGVSAIFIEDVAKCPHFMIHFEITLNLNLTLTCPDRRHWLKEIKMMNRGKLYNCVASLLTMLFKNIPVTENITVNRNKLSTYWFIGNIEFWFDDIENCYDLDQYFLLLSINVKYLPGQSLHGKHMSWPTFQYHLAYY